MWVRAITDLLAPAGSLLGRYLVAVTAVLIVAAACTIERGDVRTPSGEPPEADTLRVLKVMDAIVVAFETGDVGSLDTIFHDSVTVYEGGSVDKGWTKYRDEHLVPEMRALADRRLQFDDVRVRLAGNTAWTTCSYTLSAVRDGEQLSVSGLSTMVFQKLAGRWRLVHWHTSVSRPGGDGG